MFELSESAVFKFVGSLFLKDSFFQIIFPCNTCSKHTYIFGQIKNKSVWGNRFENFR